MYITKAWFLSILLSLVCLRIKQICGSYMNDFVLDCSLYSSDTTNATIQILGWNSRLHACFSDNPYDTFHLPLPYGYGPLMLYYDYNMIYLIHFAESKISLMGQLSIEWTDYYRMWDINEIPLGQTQVPLREIWYPQFNFISSITKRSQKLFEPDDIAVLFPEYVSVIRENVVEGHCNIDYYRFPFDEQTCVLEFDLERFFFYEDDLFLERLNYTYQFQSFENEEWYLLNVVTLPQNITFKQIEVNSTGYTDGIVDYTIEHAKTGFQVNITLRRYPQFYVVNVIVPIIILTVIGQTAFAIPEHSDGKIVVPLTVLLGFMFVQGIVATELPRSETTPSIAIYVLTCLLLSGTSVLFCAFCMWMAHMTHPMPRFIHIFLVRFLGSLLFPSQWFKFALRLWRRRRCVSPPSPPIKPEPPVSEPSLVHTSSDLSLEPVTNPEASHFSTTPPNFPSQKQKAIDHDDTNSKHLTSGTLGSASVPAKEATTDLNESGGSAPDEKNGHEEWARAAEVINRFIGLVHIAALITCFFVFVFPLLLHR